MKVVFLDRDGVINKFPGNGNYVTKIKNFHFIPGALEALKTLTENGYTIFVVSNQAGVGKGVYTQNKLQRITDYMIKHVKEAGGKIKKTYYCTHRSDSGCGCRKPGVESIEKALKTLKKTISSATKTYFIGDTGIDMLTGRNAGCKTIFVLSGREDRREMRQWAIRPDYVAKDLLDATKIIQNENSHHSRLRRRRPQKSR